MEEGRSASADAKLNNRRFESFFLYYDLVSPGSHTREAECARSIRDYRLILRPILPEPVILAEDHFGFGNGFAVHIDHRPGNLDEIRRSLSHLRNGDGRYQPHTK